MAEDNKIIPFKRAQPREDYLWNNYCAAIRRVHSDLSLLNIDSMRLCVAAFDAYMAEFIKKK